MFWKILGHIWMLPVTLVGAVYLGVLALFGQVYFGRWVRHAAIALYVPDGTWLGKKMIAGEWAGWSTGAWIVVLESECDSLASVRHEYGHVIQQMCFGVFQPVIYVIMSVWIWLFEKDLHAYLDNPFEVAARREAGQMLKVPKEMWPGDGGRWPWW
jgi:hypothetical protein